MEFIAKNFLKLRNDKNHVLVINVNHIVSILQTESVLHITMLNNAAYVVTDIDIKDFVRFICREFP